MHSCPFICLSKKKNDALMSIVLKGALKANLGSRRNHSLVVAPCLARHVPCWKGTSYLLYFSFLNTFILEISNFILKFYIISLHFCLMLCLNVWNLKFFIDWIRFWIIFYKIDMYPRSVSLHSSVHLVLRLTPKL